MLDSLVWPPLLFVSPPLLPAPPKPSPIGVIVTRELAASVDRPQRLRHEIGSKRIAAQGLSSDTPRR
jgi:hypothetical protein